MIRRSHPTSAPVRALRATRFAFTLLEVLVVVAIIVMLAGVGSYYVFQRFEDAKLSKARVDVTKVSAMVETYKLNNGGEPPPSLDALCNQQPSGGAPLATPAEILDPWGKVFMYDPQGPNNGGNKPDVYTVTPKGLTIGNWGN
jgi:general secretion pathway protein G